MIIFKNHGYMRKKRIEINIRQVKGSTVENNVLAAVRVKRRLTFGPFE